MKNRAIINFIASMSYQVLSLLVGLIIPKYYTEVFGSVYNGLNSSVSQIMSLLNVLTFGISAISIQQMFKYIAMDDKDMISAIYYDTERQYSKMGALFLVIVVPIIGLFPFLIRDDLPYWIIVWFFLLRAVGSSMEYFFQAKYSVILIAHNKSYIIYIINNILLILSTLLHLIILFTIKHIVIYQSVALLITLFRLIVVSMYIRQAFPFLRKTSNTEYLPLKNTNRNDVLVSEIAGMVIDSTDLLVLSTLSGLVNASIYSVYNFVIMGLGNVLSSCREAVFAGIGKTYFDDFDLYKKQMDRFESVYLFLVFYLYSTCILLFKPFIEVYTAKMDANYVSNVFPIMFIVARMLINFRIPSIVAINTAGYFKQVKWFAVVEAAINLFISLSLVRILGIVGVLIGTIFGAAYRTPILVHYANKTINLTNPIHYWIKILRWLPVFVSCTIVSVVLPVVCNSLISWVGYAAIIAFIIFAICLSWAWITDKKVYYDVISTCRKMIRR